jgi:hypothetical protein
MNSLFLVVVGVGPVAWIALNPLQKTKTDIECTTACKYILSLVLRFLKGRKSSM